MIIHCHQNPHNPHTLSDIYLQLLGMLYDTTLEKMYTLSIHAIFFFIRVQSSTWTTSIITILCFFSSLYDGYDGMGCFVCPDRENTFAEGLFLVILRRVLLTGNWSISVMTSLDLCLLSPEVIPASLSFGSLLSMTRDGAIALSWNSIPIERE